MDLSKKLIILSVSSDIGFAYAEHRCANEATIIGTYRQRSERLDILEKNNVSLVHLDFESSHSVDVACSKIIEACGSWDHLIVAPGLLEPIGTFEEVNFEDWERSYTVNLINPMRSIHRLLSSRNPDSSVVVFAGGGVNGSPDGFSAYTSSKIALMKNIELLDHEISDCKFTIIGPGWIKSKIHDQTLTAEFVPKHALEETISRLKTNNFGSLEHLTTCIDWVFSQDKDVVGGRNISFQHDRWETDLATLLKQNPNYGKLRRSGNKALSKF